MTHTIAMLGGTGPQGKGLAYRFARQGHRVILGSRNPENAQPVADEITARLAGGEAVTVDTNEAAAAAADVVVIAVPYAAHAGLVEELAPALEGKVVIDCVNPLAFDAKGPYSLEIEDRSAAEEAQRLAPGAHVVGAFHLVSAVNLWSEEEFLADEDILVCGEDPEAKAVVLDLAAAVSGQPGIDVGRLRMARYIEPLTAMIISINKKYKAHAGMRVAGLNR